MSKVASDGAAGRWSSIATWALGAFVGGVIGGSFVVGVTLLLKRGVDFVSSQVTWILVAVPLMGLALAVLVLQGIGRSEEECDEPMAKPRRGWTFVAFPRGAVRADITADIVDTAGEEERFPWRTMPIRLIAILATVGSGGAMGTEAPAAYLGVAAGACAGDHGRRWRRLTRPMALAGGAAGVAALMGLPLVGAAYILELERRYNAPLTVERVTAAQIGAGVGWGIDVVFHLNLIRLVMPREPPDTFLHGAITAVLIGALSGAIASLAGEAINKAKRWQARPTVRLMLGALAALVTALLLAKLAAPMAAVGPGTGAIVWAEQANAPPSTLLIVNLLRAAATTATAAAGGCGGIFVPFLAIGDIAGRVFAPGLGVGSDLAGAAGAAGGIAGGYRLPFTAVAMVLGLGGPRLATLTCLATVWVAFAAGIGAAMLLNRFKDLPRFTRRVPADDEVVRSRFGGEPGDQDKSGD